MTLHKVINKTKIASNFYAFLPIFSFSKRKCLMLISKLQPNAKNIQILKGKSNSTIVISLKAFLLVIMQSRICPSWKIHSFYLNMYHDFIYTQHKSWYLHLFYIKKKYFVSLYNVNNLVISVHSFDKYCNYSNFYMKTNIFFLFLSKESA